MSARDYFTLAAALAVAGVVCLGATVWAAVDLLSRPFAWPPAGTVAFGVAVTAMCSGFALAYRNRGRRAAQAETEQPR